MSVGALLVAVQFLCGCDWSPQRLSVSGNVTFQNKPLSNGTITFYPVSTGTQAGAVIKHGRYEIAQEKGLKPGRYRVEISSPDGQTPVDGNAAPGPSGNFASKDRIPDEFNTNSKHQIEITNGGPSRFDFAIP
jgi:hypothetical protein